MIVSGQRPSYYGAIAMTKTEKDLLVTNIVNVLLFVIIFVFGYLRWQKLQDVIVESTDSQTEYKAIHKAVKFTRELDHLGERVYEWQPSDSLKYQNQLAATKGVLDALGVYYHRLKIDSMQSALNEKGHLLMRIYDTARKRKENDEHLRENKTVTVKDTETYIKHYTGHVFRSSREEVSSKSRNRTVTVPSINEMAFIDKELYNIDLSQLNDSLAEVNKWLDVNMNQILDADDTRAEQKQEEMLEKASGIGKNTFMGGMALLLIVFGVNFRNSWRKAKAMRNLEKEAEKNKSLYKSRREMMYMVTHELKTPLTPITGYTSLMKEEVQLGEKGSYYLDKIKDSADKMKALVESLLSYFAIESAKTDIVNKPFNLKNIADTLTATYSVEATQNGLQYEVNDCKNHALMGDESKLVQIGSNLLANAIKFTEHGGNVCLNVNWEDGVLTMEVSDTGLGIAEEEQKKIFEPFKQLGKAKVMAKDGIGLGLSIVYQLVELMNGSVDVESEEGKGSKFTVRIPIEGITKENFAMSEPRTPRNDEVRRVLAIDDTESTLILMRDILTAKGVECDICIKPKDLVELMRNKDYDLLVIDLRMPEMNGIELAKTLRESEVGNSKSVKMVVMTAWNDEHDTKELLNKGFDGLLPKPFNTKDLMNMVNEFVPEGRIREIPDLTNASAEMLSKLAKETEAALIQLNEAYTKADMEQLDDWCHRLGGSWSLVHADGPIDELHDMLKKQNEMDAQTLKSVIQKIVAMGQRIIEKSNARVEELAHG